MGIQITGGQTQPAVVYDHVHMTNLMITQPVFFEDAANPDYTVELHYRFYGIADGVRYYQNEETQVLIVPNFLEIAMVDAAAGDMRLVGALQSIENAVAVIITNRTGTSAEQA